MTDEELIKQFEDQSLPYAQWTHRAHVQVAFLYARDYPFSNAVEKVRAGIQAYNASQDIHEGPTTGYNETTTVAFMHLVAATIAAYGESMPTPDSDSFCRTHPHLMSKHILRLFYSPARISHPDTKLKFVEPDLATLPQPALHGE